MSAAEPLGLLYHLWEPEMRRVAILIDGGFFLKRLPSVRPDVDCTDPVQVDRLIGQLVWSHLEYLNKQYELASRSTMRSRIRQSFDSSYLKC